MCLQIYSALLLDSLKGNWDINFSPGSCISYILYFLSSLCVPESNFSGRVVPV